MKRRKLESDTRMRYLLGNNPMGELIKSVLEKCSKRIKKEKVWSKD